MVLRGADLAVVATHTADDALMQAALRAPDAALIEMVPGDSSGTEPSRRLPVRALINSTRYGTNTVVPRR
jgi:hypothetical protein